MTTYAALLRGINVGRANRIAMAELRALFEALGYNNVRTLLNSGNIVFDTSDSDKAEMAAVIEQSIERRFRFFSAVIVVSMSELNEIVEGNPLASMAMDPSKYLVAFVSRPDALARMKPLLADSWEPEALALGKRAAYVWCANGIINSKLMKSFVRLAGETATTRNWGTVLKLQALGATTPNKRG